MLHLFRKNDNSVYADVYVYGRFSTCTYKCSADDYSVSQLVVVDVMGKRYPGRILDMYPTFPEGVPRNVKFKSIEKALQPKDKKSLDFWDDKVEQLLAEQL